MSTEITGYTISTLLWLHARGGGPEYMEAARNAGHFLSRTAWDAAARTLPFEYPANREFIRRRAYFFDLGIVARGLLRLWRACGDAEFLAAAEACAESMAGDFRGRRDYHPVLTLPSKRPLAQDTRWSLSPGCYQLKAALAWHELAFPGQYEILLQYALRKQDCFLAAEPQRERVMDRLHAYCYFLEGLLPSAGQPDCAAVLAAGIQRVGCLLREIAPLFERSDVSAQLLRLRLFADRLGVSPLEWPAVEDEASRIAAFQREDSDPRLDGGFAFGRKGTEPLPHVNPVSTAFCAQALAMWKDYRDGRFDPDWQALI